MVWGWIEDVTSASRKSIGSNYGGVKGAQTAVAVIEKFRVLYVIYVVNNV